MSGYSITEDATGRIAKRGNDASQAGAGQTRRADPLWRQHPPALWWWDGVIFKLRPINNVELDRLQIMSNGIDAVQVTKIPAGTVISWRGQSSTPSGAEDTLTVNAPGDYPVQFSSFPELDAEFTVNGY